MAVENNKGKGEDYDVVPSLMDVLSEALAAKGRTAKHVAYRADRDKKDDPALLGSGAFPNWCRA